MSEKIFDIYAKFVEYSNKLDKKKKSMYIICFFGCILVSIVCVLLLNHKDYVVLYRGLQSKECYEIVEKLDEMAVKNKVENNNTIYVEKKDEPRVKLQLAGEGYPKSTLNYDVFTNNIDFMTTDYEKIKYNLFQLQERIQASIKTINNINDAIVTITLPDNSFAVLDEDKVPPSASILLNINEGVALDTKQIKGIEQLVCKSVPGLIYENVSIIDQTGEVLNNISDDETLTSTTSRIKAENEMSNVIEKRILRVIEPIYGKKNISVGVNVTLDYNKKITESTEYTPSIGNTGIVNKYEQNYEGPASGIKNGGVPGTETNSEILGYETVDNATTNENVKKQESVDYVVNQIKEQIQKEGAEIRDITVSVLVNKPDMSEIEAEKITNIIANTSGIRSNKVELFSTEFAKPNQEIKEEDIPVEKILPQYMIYILGAALLAIAIAIIVIVILLKRKQKKKKLFNSLQTEQVEKLEQMEQLGKLADLNLVETKEQQLTEEIKEFTLKSPEITASIIRNFLRGDLD